MLLNFSSMSSFFFWYPLVHSLTLPLRLCFRTSSLISAISVFCPDLSSRDISTTLSSHHYDRWMEIVWLRDPTSIPALHTKALAHFRQFGSVFNLLLGLDLLVVVSLFLSAFSFFNSTLVFASLYYSLFVKQVYAFVLRFMFTFSFRQKIIPFGGSSTTVHSFSVLQFSFLFPPVFKNLSVKFGG